LLRSGAGLKKEEKMRIGHLLASAAVGALILAAPHTASAQVGIGVGIGVGGVGVGITANVAPPPLPVYAQPVIPGPGYIWTPGYWSWGEAGYYWVPGTWVLPPSIGVLWTPGYWGWGGGGYVWHAGYWGPHVGFYGGINYGFGYGGDGYHGGYWDHGAFRYNSAVNNINIRIIHNTYNERVENNHVTRTSFNGGRGGIDARPTREQEAFEHEHHIEPTREQEAHVHMAANDPQQRASVNHGRPERASTERPGEFTRAAAHSEEPAARTNRNGVAVPHPVERHAPSGQTHTRETARESRSAHEEEHRSAAHRTAENHAAAVRHTGAAEADRSRGVRLASHAHDSAVRPARTEHHANHQEHHR
jgi:hypothetical protein